MTAFDKELRHIAQHRDRINVAVRSNDRKTRDGQTLRHASRLSRGPMRMVARIALARQPTSGGGRLYDARVEGVEAIYQADSPVAYIVRANTTVTSTSFFTGDDATFQAGFVVNAAGGGVVPHIHLPVVRNIVGTAELLLVWRGRCIVDVYGDDRTLLASRELAAGDLVVSLGGGHGFRMLEDTVLFEVKQGPYGGQEEKERFVPGTTSTDG
jgi:hypothetical protein